MLCILKRRTATYGILTFRNTVGMREVISLVNHYVSKLILAKSASESH